MSIMPTQKKKLSRLCFLSKVISLELEEIKEEDDAYGLEFSRDFSEEQKYLIDSLDSLDNVEEPHVNNNVLNKEETIEKKEKHPAIKKIHRALAKVTHPDFSGSEDDFKKMQTAYENHDAVELLLLALDINLDIDLKNEDLVYLEELIQAQRKTHNDIKNTIRWAWAGSDKSQKMRALMQKHLGIDPKKFLIWKNSIENHSLASGSLKT